MLNIEMQVNDGVLNVKLDGELDGMTSPDFEEQLESKRTEVSKIVIDASKLEYVSSAGLRVIMATQLYMEENDKDMIQIVNVSDEVAEIIELCGFDEIIEIKK